MRFESGGPRNWLSRSSESNCLICSASRIQIYICATKVLSAPRACARHKCVLRHGPCAHATDSAGPPELSLRSSAPARAPPHARAVRRSAAARQHLAEALEDESTVLAVARSRGDPRRIETVRDQALGTVRE